MATHVSAVALLPPSLLFRINSPPPSFCADDLIASHRSPLCILLDERSAIEEWLRDNSTSPQTNAELPHKDRIADSVEPGPSLQSRGRGLMDIQEHRELEHTDQQHAGADHPPLVVLLPQRRHLCRLGMQGGAGREGVGSECVLARPHAATCCALPLLLWYAIPAGSRILAPPDHTGLRIWYDTVDFRVSQPCMLDLGRSGQDHTLFSHRPARRPWDGSQSTGSEHRI